MKFDKAAIVVLSAILCSLILLPFIVFAITTVPTPWGFINETNREAWIGYYGAIIGGALTLGGVWWTLTEQEKERNEKMKVEYKPALILEAERIYPNIIPSLLSPVRIDILKKGISVTEKNILYCSKIHIKNISNFSAKNVYISEFSFGSLDNVFQNSFFPDGLNLPDIPANAALEIAITCPNFYMVSKEKDRKDIPLCSKIDIPKIVQLDFSLHYEGTYGHVQDDSYVVSFNVEAKINNDTHTDRIYDCEFVLDSIRLK
ncbi:hypothetical protein [Holdemania filiformis]|uniref:hypothetical protein n=1 Tax=Holdemania filiformis TaxID=61171 RepID=UPI003A9061C0